MSCARIRTAEQADNEIQLVLLFQSWEKEESVNR